MLKYLSLTAAAGVLGQQVAYNTVPVEDSWKTPVANVYAPPSNVASGGSANLFGDMNPMMLMMLMDKDSDMGSMLPMLMMMGGGGGGGGGAGQIDPMMLMMMMDGDKGMSDMLPLMMMMGGGQGGQGGLGGMNPMMLMSLLDDDKKTCEYKNTLLKALKGKDDYEISIEDVANGKLFFIGADTANAVEADFVTLDNVPENAIDTALSYLDYCFTSCNSKSGDSMSELLPLMMMNGGGQGGAGGMDPMMMMLMMDGDMDSMLPFLMMSGMGGAGGASGGMDPMMMMMMMGDDKSTSDKCDKKHPINAVFSKEENSGVFSIKKIESTDDIHTFIKASALTGKFVQDYQKCLNDAKSTKKESSFEKMLPFLMMGGQQMDPMMMMLMMRD
jgi:hypothetical protein